MILTRKTEVEKTRDVLAYGVTVGVSALNLLRGQLSWMKDQGLNPVLVTTPDLAAREAAAREKVELNGISMKREISPFQDCIALINWIRFLKRVRPYAVNVSTPKAGLLGGIAAKLTKVPKRLYVVRGLRQEGAKGLFAIVLWAFEWLSMSMATDVLFVSPSLAEAARRKRLAKTRKSWVIGKGSSNGVDVDAVVERISSVNRDEVRERFGLTPADFVVGFVGRIAKDKGIDSLVDVFSDPNLLDNVKLLCIGPTEDEPLTSKLTELDGRVFLAGASRDLWALLPALDILCLPTLREGFPNVVLEAAAARIPTITTKATGAIDSVVDGETGFLVEVGDSESLVDRINWFQENPTAVTTFGECAFHRARDHFNQEKIWLGVAEIVRGQDAPLHARRLA